MRGTAPTSSTAIAHSLNRRVPAGMSIAIGEPSLPLRAVTGTGVTVTYAALERLAVSYRGVTDRSGSSVVLRRPYAPPYRVLSIRTARWHDSHHRPTGS